MAVRNADEGKVLSTFLDSEPDDVQRIYLIDCPGVCPPSSKDTPEDILLKGVIRVENVQHPGQYIDAVLRKTKPQHIERTYDVRGFTNAIEFLDMVARKGGRLLKGGEADADGVAKMVLNDFVRGKIPWFTPPPIEEGEEKGIEGRRGNLGEMGKVVGPASTASAGITASEDAGISVSEDIPREDGDNEVDFEEFDVDEDEDEEDEQENTGLAAASNIAISEDQDSTPDEGGIALYAPG